MPEVICDVSPVQYLHQAGLLDILRLRYGAITIPAAVAAELREGRRRGVDLPILESLDWVRIRQPIGRLLLPIITDLGAGERWGAMKAVLKAFSAPALMALVQDLYDVSPENRHFLQGRLLPSAAGLEKYRTRVMDAVFPNPLSRKQVRVGEAERLIRHYRLSTGDQTGVVDLMVAMVEAGTEQAADLGYANETYFPALERVLRSEAGGSESPAETGRVGKAPRCSPLESARHHRPRLPGRGRS